MSFFLFVQNKSTGFCYELSNIPVGLKFAFFNLNISKNRNKTYCTSGKLLGVMGHLLVIIALFHMELAPQLILNTS